MRVGVLTSKSAAALYLQSRGSSPASSAIATLCASLAGSDERSWLDAVRTLAVASDFGAAQAVLAAALAEHPRSSELHRAFAGVLRRLGRDAEAERAFRQILEDSPGDIPSAFALAELLRDASRVRAAAECLRTAFEHHAANAELAIRAIEFLDACERKTDAAAIAEAAIAANPDDVRLHAYAAVLEIQLAQFEKARLHCLHVLKHSELAYEWHVPSGLAQAQRYADADHPDFALFRKGLERGDLSDGARADLLFALGKASDDVGEYAAAARHFREANDLAARLTQWSPEHWHHEIEVRLSSTPFAARLPLERERAPIFIVGMPRSGTTLLAELLGRHPAVASRGELPWIPRLFEQAHAGGDLAREELNRMAAVYIAQARRDDCEAEWIIDKQPQNFRYIDFMLALWPQAKILHCRRNARDNALSLWMQSFGEDVQGFAYRFDHIAQVMNDCERLMARWSARFPLSIRSVHYESLVRDPQATLDGLMTWLGVSATEASADANKSVSSISTASLWQARQPVHAGSVERWRHYLPYAPELAGFSPDY